MDQDTLVQLLGRLHPLLLHMPIGLWFGVVALEFGGALIRRSPNRATLATLAWMAALGGAFAAGSGWILGSKGYPGDTVELHRWLGVGAGALGLVTACFAAMQNRGAFRLMLVIEFIALMGAGHFGSEITHGKEWLMEPFQQKPAATAPTDAPADAPATPVATQQEAITDATRTATTPSEAPTTEQPAAAAAAPNEPAHDPRPLFPPVDEAPTIPQPAAPIEPQPAQQEAPKATPTEAKRVTFREHVKPVLQTYCWSCHGDSKTKGDLALHTQQAIETGGENGAVLTKGKPAESSLYQRLTLPLEDDAHMPPSNKKQPTADEIELLRAWIEQGANFEPGDAAPAPTEESKPPAESPRTDEAKQTAAAATPASAPWTTEADAAIAKLHSQQIHAARIAADSDDLCVDFAAVAATMDDTSIAALIAPLKPWIADLALARSSAGTATLAMCAAMPRLVRLDLRSTKVSSELVASLRDHATLHELVLADTPIDDAAVDALLAMPRLAVLYAWNAKLSERAIARLSLKHGLRVDVGESPVATKPEPKPAEGQPAAPLKPRNTKCPVSGSPVDPLYVALVDGKAIGFCCPNCPKTFWTEPAKYPVTDN